MQPSCLRVNAKRACDLKSKISELSMNATGQVSTRAPRREARFWQRTCMQNSEGRRLHPCHSLQNQFPVTSACVLYRHQCTLVAALVMWPCCWAQHPCHWTSGSRDWRAHLPWRASERLPDRSNSLYSIGSTQIHPDFRFQPLSHSPHTSILARDLCARLLHWIHALWRWISR